MSLHVLPTPRIISAEEVPQLRWGVIGPGGIAGAFAHALRKHTNQQLIAVGGRSSERSASFADRFGIPRTHDSATSLVADPHVDAIYVATLHPWHRETALLAIEAGKHVLVEKPLAMSAGEGREIAAVASRAGVLAMEAMWTRYLPQSDILQQLLADEALGDVRFLAADFGFVAPHDPSSRLWAPELGGGALLDAGVYPISFAVSVLGRPSRVSAWGRTGPGGVDSSATLQLGWSDAGGLLATSIEAALPSRALVVGERGRVDIDTAFIGPSTLTYTPAGAPTPTLMWRDGRFDSFTEGMRDEILAFAQCVGEGLTDSPWHPLANAIGVLEIIDEARAQISSGDAP